MVPSPQHALDPDAPAVRFDDSLRDVEPEAAATAIGALLLPIPLESVGRCSAGIPGPVSATEKRTSSASGSAPIEMEEPSG